MTTSKKAAVGGMIVAGVTVYMAYVGASASWSYYVTVDECREKTSTLLGDRLRVSGTIGVDTLTISDDRRNVTFSLRGTRRALTVSYSGTLPDNLAESVEVVVEGRLEAAGRLDGDKILTRCAGKYESDVDASEIKARKRASAEAFLETRK